MKKILFSLILILSLALLCSCDDINNSAIDEETTHEHNYLCDCHPNMETVGDTTTEEKIGEITTKEDVAINNPPAIFERLVYASIIPSEINISTGIKVEPIPEDFSLASSIEKKAISFTAETKKLSFGGTTYDIKLQSKTEYKILNESQKVVDTKVVSLYKSGDATFNIVDGSGKIIDLMIFDKRYSDSNNKTITQNEAKVIAENFLKEYSLNTSLENFELIYQESNTCNLYYKLNICGYEILGEQYVVAMNKSGEIYMFSDNTTGIYDKFIGKVTEEDIRDAEERLYPYHIKGAYGYYTPYLKIGNDGNLYLCSSYFVDEVIDGVEIAREYMFYSRVYYEE